MRLALTLAALAALVLSGCVDEGPPVTARGIDDAPVEAGEGPFTLRVLVTHGLGGEPVAGAGVVVYWPEIELPEIDFDASNPQGDIRVQWDEPTVDGVIRLKTGPDGIAVARVEAGQTVGIVVAKDGYTEEWMPGVPTGQAGEEATVRVPVFLTQLSGHINSTWSGPLQQGFTGTEWDPQMVQFHMDPAVSQGYRERLIQLEVTVTWSNSLTGAGDLAAAAGTAPSSPAAYSNEQTEASPGTHSETLLMDRGSLEETSLRGGGLEIYVGPATSTAFVAPSGLEYQVSYVADFGGLRQGSTFFG